MIDVDSLLISLNPTGLFQLGQYIVSDISMIPFAVALLKIVFIGSIPDTRCSTLNESQLYEHGYGGNETHEVIYGECNIDIYSRTPNGLNFTLACLNGYTYAEGKDYSLVSEWDLVCDKAGLAELTQTFFSIGGLIGALTVPYFSDTRGRKPILVLSNFFLLIFSMASSFSPNYYVFVAFRVLEGITVQGLAVAAYTIMLELYPVSKRTLMSGLSGVTWGLCVLPIGPIGYLFRNFGWRVNNAVFACCHLMAFFQMWYLEESLRWLITNGDIERSKKILKRATKQNRVDFDRLWESNMKATLIPLVCEEKRVNVTSKEELAQQLEVKEEGFHTIFKDSLARIITLIIFINGFMNSTTYNTVYMMSPSLAGNRFLNFCLISLTEVFANITMTISLFRLQRRVAMSLYQCLAGVSLLAAVVVSYVGDGSSLYSILNTMFSLLGMFGISASYCIIWLYTPEVYPTNLRNIGLGFLTLSGNIGNMLSPFSRVLKEYIPWLPGTICGTGCMASVVLLYFMPESKRMQMPATMMDVRAQMRLQKGSKDKQTNEINHIT